MEEKKKHRIESDRARHAAKTAEQKKLGKPRREKIEHAACVAAHVATPSVYNDHIPVQQCILLV